MTSAYAPLARPRALRGDGRCTYVLDTSVLLADPQAVVRFDETTRTIIDGRPAGFCKLIADRATATILGCHVVGERAVEIVQVVAIAIAASFVDLCPARRASRRYDPTSRDSCRMMIGITAAASAVIYALHGGIDPYVAGPTAIGVFLGATGGSRIAHRIQLRYLRLLFVVVLAYTAVQMLIKALG